MPTPTPLRERLPIGQGTAQWPVWSTTARVVLTAGDHPELLDDARAIVGDLLARVAKACSRFQPDAEIHRLYRAAGRTITVSPLLAELVATALAAARHSGGAVDPTVGAAMNRLGYDKDLSLLPVCGGSAGPRHRPAPGWHVVRLDGRRLSVPAGVSLDLGATAKAFAADRAAKLLAAELGAGALVSLGGDIATAGPSPAGGWRVLVEDRPGDPACTITLPPGAAVATSSVQGRAWRRGGEHVHHIVDPATGAPADTPWRTVTAVAHTCVQANTLTTAAVVRGDRAPDWLRRLGAPARLVAADGAVVTVGAWHAEPAEPAPTPSRG